MAVMDGHAHHHPHGDASSWRVAALATAHCLTGCAIGEVLGMVIGTALGWGTVGTLLLAVVLAFAFGYGLTMVPLLRSGLAVAVALPLAFASDSLSIAVMEIVDNVVMLTVPGAMEATLSSPLFWAALAGSLAVAFVVALPVNRALIARGRGHAVVHGGAPDGSTVARAPLVALGAGSLLVTLAVVVLAVLLVE